MNGLEQRNRTFGELLTELKARLSFVAQGPSSNNNNPVLTSFLQEGHDYLYEKLKPPPARKKTTITINAGSYLYDFHNDIEDEYIDPDKVLSMWVIIGSGERVKLTQGVSEADREFTQRGYPTRYDNLNGQIELWPIPDRTYGLVVEYIAPQPRFSQPSDRPGVPDRLILLYAIANAKAHYRHPDAQAAGATFASMLEMAQSNRHENKRYIVNGHQNVEETVRSTPSGYSFRVR